MKSALLLVAVLSLFVNPSEVSAKTVRKGAKQKNDGQSRAVGYYSEGSLENGVPLAQESDGHRRLYQKQDVRYGVQAMIDLIMSATGTFIQQYPEGERLQVGDISKKGGGKLHNHASHQNGLDLDAIYFRIDKREQEESEESDKEEFDEHFVADGQLSKNFDLERNWEFFKLLFESAKINRIFVDQVIKDELCRYADQIGELESGTEVLRRLRHWPKHDDHFHLRLECPENSTACTPQEPPPAGHGCLL